MTVQNRHTDYFLDSFDSAPLIKNSSIIDIGCGDGYASAQFLARGASDVTAIEPTLRTNERPSWLIDSTATVHNSWEPVFINDKKYDIVWTHHVIEHVEDCFGFLRDIHSLLADTGQLWLACPNMAQHATFSPGHIHNFQAAQLVEVLRLTGFAIEQISVSVIGGQLRIRAPKTGSNKYPTPMYESLANTGRCPSELLNNWNWR
jgi:2-polyprenyl-3-methyl-5-hydroxy-6-metoxy-1,4-benzoquinol methylase